MRIIHKVSRGLKDITEETSKVEIMREGKAARAVDNVFSRKHRNIELLEPLGQYIDLINIVRKKLSMVRNITNLINGLGNQSHCFGILLALIARTSGIDPLIDLIDLVDNISYLGLGHDEPASFLQGNLRKQKENGCKRIYPKVQQFASNKNIP
jgi:hypothetical protein